jgi:heme/copper-type cytochrome/quinol oxidase subunit 2
VAGHCGEPAVTRHLSRTWLIVAVAVAVLVAGVLAVVVQRLSNQNESTGAVAGGASAQSLVSPAGQAALAAAIAATRATLTYNYRTLPANISAAEAGMTPAFRASYENSIKRQVESAARTYHAISTATVAAGGLSAATPTTASALLFVDQTVQNSRLKAPRLDRSRVKVSMVKQNGRWLISELTPI